MPTAGRPIKHDEIYRVMVGMEKGDSILCESENDAWAARHAAKMQKWKVCVRKCMDGSGWRVWRIA